MSDLKYYPEGSILIRGVGNGCILTIKGTIKDQGDNIEGSYVFTDSDSLASFVKKTLKDCFDEEV